jgi:hypothetical protein
MSDTQSLVAVLVLGGIGLLFLVLLKRRSP